MSFKRILLISLVIAAVGGALMVSVKNLIVRRMVREVTRSLGGFEVAIDQAHFGILAPTIELTGIKVTNPTNYPVREALEINRIFVRYDRKFLSGGVRHLPELDLDVAKIVFVQLPDGRANLEELTKLEATSGFAAPAPAAAPAPPAPRAPATATNNVASAPPRPHPPAPAGTSALSEEMTIGRLHIKIDKVDFLQYARAGEEPIHLPAEVNLDRTFEQVESLDDVMDQLQGQLMVGSLFKSMGFEPPRMEGSRKDDAREAASKAVDQQIEDVIRETK